MNNKVCVVGAGYWGQNHIKTLFQMGIEVGVVDLDIKSLKHIEKKYPLNRIYKTIDEALLDDFDAYIVSTPAETHFNVAKKIILSKKYSFPFDVIAL